LEVLAADNLRAAQAKEDAATAIRLKLLEAGIDATPETATTRVATELARAQAAFDQAKQDLARAEKLQSEIADATEKAQVARELSLLMRSNNFPQWLINSALTALIGEASTVLFELSNGQFELTSEEGNLFVIDHNNADLTRSVKTLSGGETFQASLALALALSRQMSALSTSGSAKLEAIFLDEGFGTLDGETLDEVASTLETLSASGSRMVGVVTHVPALADRIPVRLRVSRDDKGSHVEVERV
jgi:exonuclease SbcC